MDKREWIDSVILGVFNTKCRLKYKDTKTEGKWITTSL